jgi:hypothetical protein
MHEKAIHRARLEQVWADIANTLRRMTDVNYEEFKYERSPNSQK